MAFGFRKSINLGGGARLNLSNSGLGVSFGIRGIRVSANSRGTFVSMGGHGIRYRARIGEPPGQPSGSQSNFGTGGAYQVGTPVQTASVADLVDQSSAALLDMINGTLGAPARAWLVVLVGLLVALGLQIFHWGFALIAAGIFGYLTWAVSLSDARRRTYNLDYNLDDSSRATWIAMNSALHGLRQTQGVWRVTTQDHNYDWKRNAGATTLIGRLRSRLDQRQPFGIHSQPFTPYCLDVGVQQLYFLPDRLYVFQNGRYGAVDYNGLQVTSGRTQYIESEAVYSDAVIVGETWQYVNKNGGPDRRFSNNRVLPVMAYGVVTLQSASGLNCRLMTSSIAVADQFAQSFAAGRIPHPVGSGSHSRPHQSSAGHQARSQQPPPQSNQSTRYETPPHPQSGSHESQRQAPRTERKPPPSPPKQAPSIPECYRILKLSPTCSKEEARAQHRKLAADYHPDRVNSLAVEFRELAHTRMVEINNAYTELQKLRGW